MTGKFEVHATISGVIEAKNSYEAKEIFKKGYDVGYVVNNMRIVVLPEYDMRKPMNARLQPKLAEPKEGVKEAPKEMPPMNEPQKAKTKKETKLKPRKGFKS